MLITKRIKLLSQPAVNPITGDITAYATVKSIVSESFSFDPNLRDPEQKGIQKKLRENLRENPEKFSRSNQGILFTARSYKFDEKTLDLLMDMHQRKDPKKSDGFDDGVPDGAHSYDSLCDEVQALEDLATDPNAAEERRRVAQRKLLAIENNAAIRIEVIIGMSQSELPVVCENRNTSKKQKMLSLINHREAFKPLVAALNAGGTDIASHTKFYEGDCYPTGDKKPFDAEEMARFTYVIVADAPQSAYTSSTGFLKHYEEMVKDSHQGLSKVTLEVMKLCNLVSNVHMAVDDYVDEQVSKGAKNWKEADLKARGITPARSSSRILFSSTKKPKYEIPLGYILLLFGTVTRNNFDPSLSSPWKKNVVTEFAKNETKLVKKVFDVFDAAATDPSAFGKKARPWHQMDLFYESL